MIKLKLKSFLKVCRVRSLRNINFIFLSLWNFFLKKDYMTQNVSIVRRKKKNKEKEGGRKMKREKEN